MQFFASRNYFSGFTPNAEIFPICFAYLTFATIVPRFIISVRELYSRDVQGRWQGIDTGFGLSSHTVSSQYEMSAIAFADVAERQAEEEVEDNGV